MKSNLCLKNWTVTILWLTVGFITIRASSGPLELTVQDYPSPKPAKVLFTLTGSLTEVVDELEKRNERGEDIVGWHYCEFQVLYKVGNIVEEACCADIAKRTAGKKLTAEISHVDVSITKDEMHLPVWNNRTSTCKTATDEWNRWFNIVETHELGHRSRAKDFFKLEKIEPIIQPLKRFLGTVCTEDATYDSDKALVELKKQGDEYEALAISSINNEHDKIQNAYDDAEGTISFPNKRNECP